MPLSLSTFMLNLHMTLAMGLPIFSFLYCTVFTFIVGFNLFIVQIPRFVFVNWYPKQYHRFGWRSDDLRNYNRCMFFLLIHGLFKRQYWGSMVSVPLLSIKTDSKCSGTILPSMKSIPGMPSTINVDWSGTFPARLWMILNQIQTCRSSIYGMGETTHGTVFTSSIAIFTGIGDAQCDIFI